MDELSSPARACLRASTWLAPGIPLAFFEGVCRYLASALGCDVELASETRSSGPMEGDHDPFAAGEVDLGFLCSPSYIHLASGPDPSVELVPAGFAFADARYRGEPVYYSDVVVRADHPATAFADLAGGVWGFNDTCSLSGYFAARQALHRLGRDGSFFAREEPTGSHHASIEAVLTGAIDAAAIDSNVLALVRRERPELRGSLRVLDAFGPFPIQPVVVRRGLTAGRASRIADALLRLRARPAGGPDGSTSGGAGHARALARFGLERLVPVTDSDYEDERRALAALGRIPVAAGGSTPSHLP